MKKFILLLMVFMFACAAPALAVTDFDISGNEISLHAQFSLNDLVETPAAIGQGFVLVSSATKITTYDPGVVSGIESQSPEVTFPAHSKPADFLSLDNTTSTNMDNAATDNPGKFQFDYGPSSIAG